MRVAVVGNRDGWTYDKIRSELHRRGIGKKDVIISGGAEGVDSFADLYAKRKGCIMVTFNPDPDKPSPDRYEERNQRIVNACGMLIAFNLKRKSGTQQTINMATKASKKVIIITR